MHKSFTMETRESASPTEEPMLIFTNFTGSSLSIGNFWFAPLAGSAGDRTATDPTILANNTPEYSTLSHKGGTITGFTLRGTLPPGTDSINFQIFQNGANLVDLGTIVNGSNDGFGNAFQSVGGFSIPVAVNSVLAYRIDTNNMSVQWNGTLELEFTPNP